MKRSIVLLIAASLLVPVFQAGCTEPSAASNSPSPQGNTKAAPASTATVASSQQPVAEKPVAEKPVVAQPVAPKPVQTPVADKPKIPDPPKAIVWAKDWESAKKSAGEHRQLVMADFYTDSCGWCKKLDRDTFTNTDVIQLTTRFVPLKVNARGDGSALAQQYGVRSYPMILFLDSNGKIFSRIQGYFPPDAFADRLQEIQKSFSKS